MPPREYKCATCRSCKAPVIWTESEATQKRAGRRMPIDADPDNPSRPLEVDDGNLVIVAHAGRDDYDSAATPIVRYVSKGAKHFRSHFASCKDAGSWRKK